ncbi:hypothetical protein HOT99_gp029 [Caulobacter phage CcrBL10]|uniref:Uncharacterized protein n=1 Tax=Caulobacter phage CcrBL10 TaxID=2283269 RepID=A0A385E8U9_9CAUD|nr:hypothetical protein HOT99_gp029 [Caulobacter phage CcrBL10]AXQ68233.1 hypothetical protein CcrBL10_gp029 [Caulobacter phage CcrBL10]
MNRLSRRPTSLRIGQFDRDYTTEQTYWVPRGFSKQSDRYVYPNTGWSWTDWGSEVQDTFETLAEAKAAIASGYLKNMIEAQEIVDIVFLEVKVDRQIVEKKSVKAYAAGGKLSALDEPKAVVGPRKTVVSTGDYVFVRRLKDSTGSMLFGRVQALHKDVITIWVINGAWTLLLRYDGADLFVAADDRSAMKGEPMILEYAGPLPDPTSAPRDYAAQRDALSHLKA